jgi:hypothetical protein
LSRDFVPKYNNFVKGYYNGEFRDGYFQGQGELCSQGPNCFKLSLESLVPFNKEDRNFSIIYISNGQFTGNELDGECRIKFVSDSKKSVKYPIVSYDGSVKGGLFNGKGELCFSNGDKYQGLFLDGVRQGLGEYISNSVMFEGEWFEDKLHGKVEITFYDDGGDVIATKAEEFKKGIPVSPWMDKTIALNL